MEGLLLNAEQLGEDVAEVSAVSVLLFEQFVDLLFGGRVAAGRPVKAVAATHAVEVGVREDSFHLAGLFVVLDKEGLLLRIENAKA